MLLDAAVPEPDCLDGIRNSVTRKPHLDVERLMHASVSSAGSLSVD